MVVAAVAVLGAPVANEDGRLARLVAFKAAVGTTGAPDSRSMKSVAGITVPKVGVAEASVANVGVATTEESMGVGAPREGAAWLVARALVLEGMAVGSTVEMSTVGVVASGAKAEEAAEGMALVVGSTGGDEMCLGKGEVGTLGAAKWGVLEGNV